jgi:hypothetical protein
VSDISTTRIFTDGEKGITATKLNDIIGSSSIQTSFVSSKPVASSTAAGDNLLLLKTGGTYAQIDSSAFATAMVPLLPAPEPKIWSVRLRSFNAVGNPTFEVDQRNCFGTLTNPANGTFQCDRWQIQRSGTFTLNGTAIFGQYTSVPNTFFYISQSKFNLKLTGQQTTLGATDFLVFGQTPEGPRWRELVGDVTSISVLVYSDVALKFSVFIRSPDGTRSLCKLCTVSAAAWTLVTLPNIPAASGGNFNTFAGQAGYNIGICLAAGSTLTAPVNDTWQNGNFVGAAGMDNWASKAVNSNFYAAFIQHEPGSQCTTPMDCPFGQNLDGDMGCLRYYQKSYDYAVKPGTVSPNGKQIGFGPAGWQQTFISVSYPKRLAKNVAPIVYSPVTGTINAMRRQIAAADVGCTAFGGTGETGFSTPTAAASIGANDIVEMHYTADTGW